MEDDGRCENGASLDHAEKHVRAATWHQKPQEGIDDQRNFIPDTCVRRLGVGPSPPRFFWTRILGQLDVPVDLAASSNVRFHEPLLATLLKKLE